MSIRLNATQHKTMTRQRGITTLIVAILLLVILTVAMIFATNVGVFEQRSASNENRARLAHEAAEAALNLSSEALKGNIGVLVSEVSGRGWLDSAAPRWQPCTTAFTPPAGEIDPCNSVPATRRDRMYRYLSGGSADMDYESWLPAEARVTAMGNGFPTTTKVFAALCRLDTTNPAAPFCSLNPNESRLFSITLVAQGSLTGEDTVAEVKQTMGTFRVIGGAANVPLVASGLMSGLGNGSIVTSANAGGWGVPISIWSPNDISIDGGGGGGIGTVSTCHMQEFLGSTPRDDLFTTCAGPGNPCGCPNNDESLSGALGGSIRREVHDILDIDGGNGAVPDVTYFPSHRTQVATVDGVSQTIQLDDQANTLDDSLFEWIFNQDVVDGTGAATATQPNVRSDCGDGTEDCAHVALRNLQAIERADCSTLSAASTGLYWIRGDCDLPGQVGTPEAPVVVVVEENAHVRSNTVFFGMLFVRSSDNTATFDGNGGADIFGSVVVEGPVSVNGGLTIIYAQEITDAINNSPVFTRFGRVPGTWLDDSDMAF